jgi:cysteine sulfinate desulfinase/cysteine desulfurase-like protein
MHGRDKIHGSVRFGTGLFNTEEDNQAAIEPQRAQVWEKTASSFEIRFADYCSSL